MSRDRDTATGGRTEPARAVGPVANAMNTTMECPDCHAANLGDISFCGACGYDLVTGMSPVQPAEDEVPIRPTTLQAGELHDAYVDPHRYADDIQLTTPLGDLALDAETLPQRPEVPPPVPPSTADEHVAHACLERVPLSRQGDVEWVAEVWVDHEWAAGRDSRQPVPEAGLPEVVPLTTHHAVIGRTNVARGLHPNLDARTDMGVSMRHAQLTSDGRHWWVEDLDTSNGTYVSTVGEELPTEPIVRGMRVRIDEDDRIYLGGWTRLQVRRTL